MTTKICQQCGGEYSSIHAKSLYCSVNCGQRARRAAGQGVKVGPVLDAEVSAWLDVLTAEFDRAIRTDWGYVVEFAEVGAKVLAKREAA